MSVFRRINFPKKVLFVLTACVILVLLFVAKNNVQMSNLNLHMTSNGNGTASRYVTIGAVTGRLGNQMFNFAALFFAGLYTNREVVLFNGHGALELEKYFSLQVRKVNRSCPCFTIPANLERNHAGMEAAIRSQAANNSQAIIILHGIFVSWKYIEAVQELVWTRMKFRKNIEDLARDFLRQNIPKGWTEGQFTRVGIHSRRGDFLDRYWSSRGYTTAPESYFKNAMKYFADRYKLVQFVVASDDMIWSMQHIRYDSQSVSANVSVIYSEKHSPGQDMAILSQCDHAIMSTGTFGWMAAWLANGTTVYYANFPSKGSIKSKKFYRLDNYPPHWIPME